MLNWYTRITVNLGEIPNFIQHFETEIENSKKELITLSENKSYLKIVTLQKDQNF